MRYEIKEMGVSEILDQAVNLFKNHMKLLLLISCCISIPFSVVQGLTLYMLTPEINPDMANTMNDPVVAQQMMGQMSTLLVVSLVFLFFLLFIVNPVTSGATIYAISSEYLDRPVTVGESIRYSFSKLGKLLVTNIYAGILISVGLMACLVPGLYLMLRYMFVSQIVILEDTSGDSALKRSAELVKDNMGTAIILGILLFAIGFGANFISAMVPVPIIRVLIQVVVQALLTIFGTVAVVVLYYSNRCKFEDFDLSVLADSVSASSELEAGSEM